MDKKVVIVGHGLVGCVLALSFYRREIPFRIVGCAQTGEASPASSGLIAPITGRRYVKAWRIDEYIAKALIFYNWTESKFGEKYFFPVEIVRFLSDEEANKAWHKRLEDPEYAAYISNKKYDILDERNRPYGILTGGYRLDTPGWLNAARSFLLTKELLEICAKPFMVPASNDEKIIYATGAIDQSISGGIIPNKGEALLVRMEDWKIPVIIKEEVFIVPQTEKGLFWVGSYYQPWPDNPYPTPEGKDQILQSLRKVYSGTIDVIDHLAGIRPTVDDRRPLIGAYPGHPLQYIFNGMGTKGTSLAPFWADELISHLTEDLPLPKVVSPSRYISG